jgi:hypothetical protein
VLVRALVDGGDDLTHVIAPGFRMMDIKQERVSRPAARAPDYNPAADLFRSTRT